MINSGERVRSGCCTSSVAQHLVEVTRPTQQPQVIARSRDELYAQARRCLIHEPNRDGRLAERAPGSCKRTGEPDYS